MVAFNEVDRGVSLLCALTECPGLAVTWRVYADRNIETLCDAVCLFVYTNAISVVQDFSFPHVPFNDFKLLRSCTFTGAGDSEYHMVARLDVAGPVGHPHPASLCLQGLARHPCLLAHHHRIGLRSTFHIGHGSNWSLNASCLSSSRLILSAWYR